MIIDSISSSIIQADGLGALAACSPNGQWKELNIGGVINTALELAYTYEPSLLAIKIPLIDVMTIPPELFDTAVQFHKTVKEKKKVTLVHCLGGINRSSTVIAALLIAEGEKVDSALRRLPRKPWGSGLVESLREWAKQRKY